MFVHYWIGDKCTQVGLRIGVIRDNTVVQEYRSIHYQSNIELVREELY